ncbi:collagen alpha-1(I) chain-like [Cyprinodon tularosa]|uniref:collagen alpha-1(I) chain-like n=1 Tax=Cyprinodon tularosa TaxID=77115 RepID=UPI0018E211C8|nr:collagen alpha-1(I) chain-like [Cyprinodon tularosa]
MWRTGPLCPVSLGGPEPLDPGQPVDGVGARGVTAPFAPGLGLLGLPGGELNPGGPGSAARCGRTPSGGTSPRARRAPAGAFFPPEAVGTGDRLGSTGKGLGGRWLAAPGPRGPFTGPIVENPPSFSRGPWNNVLTAPFPPPGEGRGPLAPGPGLSGGETGPPCAPRPRGPQGGGPDTLHGEKGSGVCRLPPRTRPLKPGDQGV